MVTAPAKLFSQNGVLNVTFNYFTTVDSSGRTLFCFTTSNGLQGPTLHVLPGDTLNISVTNQVPAPPPGSPTEVVSNSSNNMAAFNSHVVGLRGAPGQIRAAAREFHVYYRARSLGNGEYTVDHSSLVAPDGQSAKLLADSVPVAKLTDDLFAMVSEGLPYMPAFAGVIKDVQITATIAYIKATWPVGLRISQALLNPGHAGMPAMADPDWTLPPTCTISAQRWRTTSR